MPQTVIESTAQQFLEIHDITNDIVLMKDGTASIVITVDAMNFGLLAEEEQDAVMYAYAGLLNSLNYPIQIVIRSQTKDVTGYLHLLQDQERKASSRENQKRISRYREFVSNLIHERNVLDKKFYVVIPATNLELGLFSPQGLVPGGKAFDINSVEKTVIIEKAKNLLEPKRDHIISQFARIGLYSRQLNTQEIIQLFYVSYNPEASEGQIIDESRSYTMPLVKASIESSNMINATQSPPSNSDSGQPAAPSAPAESSAPTEGSVPATPPAAPPSMSNPGDSGAPTSPPPAMPSTEAMPAAEVSPPASPAAPTSPPSTSSATAPTSEAPATPASSSMPPAQPMAGEMPKPSMDGATSTPPAMPDAPAATSSMPSSSTPAGGSEDAMAQEEINKTVGTMPATPATSPGGSMGSSNPVTADSGASAGGDSGTNSKDLPEI